MHRIAVSSVVLALAFAGCALDRSPLSPVVDAGILPTDVPSLDAPRADVPGLDAPTTDVPGLDAPMMDVPAPDDVPMIDAGFDAGFDAGLPDVPLDTPPDVPVDARCSTGPDRDGDGVRDVCDPCPDDAADDADGDGRCDSMDVCPGQDDRIDGDGDGTPDGCDSWPCGTEPTVALPVTVSEATVTSLSLGGGDNTVVASAGTTLTASVGYSIVDCGCSGCIDQIEVGLVPGARSFCAYDGNPMCRTATTGTFPGTIAVPAASGVYEVRFTRAQDWSCNDEGRTDWWLGTPGGEGRIGVICVR